MTSRSVLLSFGGQPLVTDGPKHSAENWALHTAQKIFPADDVQHEAKRRQALAFQLRIAELLEPHHERHQDRETASLTEKGDDQLDAPMANDAAAAKVVLEVVAASKGTAFEDYCARPEWMAVAQTVVETDMNTSSHIERQLHCQRKGASLRAAAWLTTHHPKTEE